MAKKVLVILGHPRTDSLCGAIANAYAEGAAQAGHSVEQIRLGELRFDPVLHAGYLRVQELEPDLVAARQRILEADHLVWVLPSWWGGLPSLVKGFMDRVLLPGFAFKYRENSPWWDRLLAGRTAELWMTMDAPPWYYRWVVGRPAYRQMKTAILGFCGIKLLRYEPFGPVRRSSPERRSRWIERARQSGYGL